MSEIAPLQGEICTRRLQNDRQNKGYKKICVTTIKMRLLSRH